MDLREFIDPHSKKNANILTDMVSEFWLEANEGSIPSDFQSPGKLIVDINEFASWHKPAKAGSNVKSKGY
jgi:hypothetical protein